MAKGSITPKEDDENDGRLHIPNIWSVDEPEDENVVMQEDR